MGQVGRYIFASLCLGGRGRIRVSFEVSLFLKQLPQSMIVGGIPESGGEWVIHSRTCFFPGIPCYSSVLRNGGPGQPNKLVESRSQFFP